MFRLIAKNYYLLISIFYKGICKVDMKKRDQIRWKHSLTSLPKAVVGAAQSLKGFLSKDDTEEKSSQEEYQDRINRKVLI